MTKQATLGRGQGKADRTRAAQRAAEIRKAHEAREARRRRAVVGGVAVAVLALLLGLGYALQAARDTTGQAASDPAGADGYAVPVGDADAAVVVDLYEDFMCPACGDFEAAAGPLLEERVESGDVLVRYHPISILDRFSTTRYSTRSANAMAAVLDDAGPDVAAAFHGLLFEHQPAEGTAGLSDEQLVDLAVEAGSERVAVEKALDDETFEQWVVNGTDQASRDGVSSTPSVLVDGERVEFVSDWVSALDAAVEAALAD